jgi:hypothetical protein
MDSISVHGGEGSGFQKLLEFGLIGFAINNIVSLAKSFSDHGVSDHWH